MAGKQRLQYFILRYAPNPLSDANAAICVVLYDPTSIEAGFCKVGFKPGWKSDILKLGPDADIQVIEATVRDLDHQLTNPETRRQVLEFALGAFSNALRISEPKECLSQNPTQTLNDLVTRLV